MAKPIALVPTGSLNLEIGQVLGAPGDCLGDRSLVANGDQHSHLGQQQERRRYRGQNPGADERSRPAGQGHRVHEHDPEPPGSRRPRRGWANEQPHEERQPTGQPEPTLVDQDPAVLILQADLFRSQMGQKERDARPDRRPHPGPERVMDQYLQEPLVRASRRPFGTQTPNLPGW